MSARQASTWRPLPGVEVPGIPGLLVSTDFTAQSYTIHVTDLANVWAESLDKKPIIMRGLKEDTSIDPTDGPDQIRKLLDLIRAAFDRAAPEHGDTSLALSKSTDHDDGDDLEIYVSVVLPKPLRPLKWPIYLRKLPQSAVATELVLPLVHSHRARAREVDELMAALAEKDAVVTKLVDKLESSGIGLEHVFNALSGRRKVTRAMAEERIRGLAPFRESDFRKHTETADREGDAPDDMVALLDSVFGAGPGLPSGSALDIGDSPALNDWWTRLGKGKTAALVSRGKDKASASASSAKGNPQAASAPATRAKPEEDDDETASEGEDDFQVQHSPPGKKDDYNKKANETQDDVEDDDFQVQATPPGRGGHSTQISSQTAAAQDDDDQDEDIEVQATPPSRKRDRRGRATRMLNDDDEPSDGDGAEIPDSMPAAATKSTSRPNAPGTRLGAIGGRSKQHPPTKQDPPPPRHPSPTPSPSPPHTRAHPAPAAAAEHDNASATASEPDDDDNDNSPPPAPPPKPARRRGGGGIGRIGGRKPTAKEATPEPRSSGTPPAASQQTPRRRMGVIGKGAPGSAERGRGRTRTPGDGDGEGEEGEKKVEDEEENEEKRETSLERAERRRAELKRELEARQSQPVRKKRKF